MMSQLVLEAYIESETQAILQDCTTCGKCVDVCPMLPYGNLQGSDSKHVVSGILDILRGGQGHDEARRWAQVCTASGSCIPACPEGINPRKMLNLTKHTLKNRERLQRAPSDTYFKRMAQSIRLLVGTQMMPEQYRRLTGLSPTMKSRADVIFYLGCNVLRTPHIVFNVMDILEAMELDYEVLVLQRGFTPGGSPVRFGACDGSETPQGCSAVERPASQALTAHQRRVGAIRRSRPSPPAVT
jgi:heterodisulfide reductase subunit D